MIAPPPHPSQLWRRYALGVALLVALLMGGHALHLHTLGQSARDATVIDVSGRQRMLSQRMAGLAQDLVTTDGTLERSALAAAVALFGESHEQLVRDAERVPAARAIYDIGAPGGLDAQSRAFVADVERLLALSPGDPERAEITKRLKSAAFEPLLHDLNAAVQAFAADAEARLEELKQLQHLALGFALALLLVEGLLIFWPAQRCVVDALRAAEERADELLAKNRELERMTDRLEHAAYHDQLTGLANRKRLNLELKRRLERPNREKRGLCVLHVDLDRFKEINDTLGHPVGDEVLRRTGEVMRAQVRREDLVARVGGDEFVIVLDAVGPEPQARVQRIAEGVIARVRTPLVVDGHTCTVGASIGFAFASDSGWDADRMIGNADIALYEAKRAGKGVAVAFAASMRGGMERRHALIQELESAVDAGQFVPYFQPKVSLKDGRVVGFEVLTRWQHPTRGVLTPSAFLDLAEETGLVETIDRQAVSGALDALACLRGEGWQMPTLSVNASAASLRNLEYAADLEMATAMHGLRPSDVRVEVVESTLITNDDDPALATLRKLVAEGFRVDLDDFGTGYASLATLARLDLSGLKIDMGLIKTLDDPRSAQIVQAVVGLGKGLDLEVVAEGVEIPQHFAILKRMGCDVAQGFLIAEPMPRADLAPWLRDYGRAPLQSAAASRSAPLSGGSL